MTTVESDEWAIDLRNMTCRNTKNNIVVIFKKVEGNIVGKIKNLPIKIVNEWTAKGLGNKSIKKAVIEAEIVFMKRYHGI
jgi:hypothetical protein